MDTKNNTAKTLASIFIIFGSLLVLSFFLFAVVLSGFDSLELLLAVGLEMQIIGLSIVLLNQKN